MWLFSLLDFAQTHTHHTHTHPLSSLSHAQLHIYQEYADIQQTNVFTFYQITLCSDCLKTQISYLHPQHYACVDEYSNCSIDWMPYYILHRHNGPSPLCLRLCFIKLLLLLYNLLHTSQLYRRSPLCMHWCVVRWPFWLNALLHTWHEYGRSPLCMRLCLIRLLLSLYALLHKSQT